VLFFLVSRRNVYVQKNVHMACYNEIATRVEIGKGKQMKIREFDNLLMDKLEALYGKDVPDEIAARCVRERNYLQLSEFQDEFWVFSELLMEMKKKGIRYSIFGTAVHSFFLYLLLQLEMNPLPAHYYCPRCKEILFIEGDDEVRMGIDLPRKLCKCGCELKGEGFNLAEEFFWEGEMDLGVSVLEEDYEYVKAWLSSDGRLKGMDIEEDDWSDVDEEDIVKRYKIGEILVLAEKSDSFKVNKIGWEEVRKHKEKVIENYELILPCNRKIKNNPRSLYEVIRVVAFFCTMYTKSTECCVGEEDILDAEEMYLLLEKFYDNDINKAPVFLEDGLMIGEWKVEEYKFLILFTRACAEYVLDEINDKMKTLFEEEVNE